MKIQPIAKFAPPTMLPLVSTIREIKPEAASVSTFYLDVPPVLAARGFQPGQFNMLYVPGHGEVAISVSSDPAKPERIGHTIRFTGAVTRAIEKLRVGDQLGIRGPFGKGWPMQEAIGKDLLIVSGGIGLAPLRPVLYEVVRNRGRYGRVVLLYGGRTPSDLLYQGEFESWRNAGIEMHVSVDRADEHWSGAVGVIPIAFYRIRIDHRNTIVLSCGPEIMMRFVIFEALARRIPKDAIYISMERNMKCGYGICGHCQIGSAFVCKDGPVFTYAEFEPYFGKEDF